MKLFERWKYEEVELTFGTKRVKTLPSLTEWLKFIHEYKPLNKTTSSDPLGQLLIAMLATQTLNDIKRPLYGTYIRGSNWQFVVLENNQYSVSDPFDALRQVEMFKIFSILKRCKSYIEEWVK